MKTYRMTAVIVGILYIIGTLSGILSVAVTRDLFAGEDFLTKIAENQSQLNLGALMILIMGLSLAAMPVFLYPLFKRKNQALALGMVVFRGPLEGSTYILVVVGWLWLGVFSKEFLAAGAESVPLQVVGNVFLQTKNIVTPVLTIVFIIGAMLLYTLFYLTKLIPRWLSGWGLIAAVFYVTVDLVILLGFNLHLDVLYIPLAVQEMVMALWLISKGFNQVELDRLLTERNSV
ncbi:DUF4386 domain-containing protein [Halalkalibacter sp. APA_J-10(15)]|uniref:DUF4386 domain-containing protein n=1 Tax=Halalkalibacter sp. APA_J-10(15) TaxID=2933805 RepID=UPI001FF16D96|nr:DUF4386 domain-containing protein [Halalkalibacter sp. APA_J-10(15)]MCK0469850.1 DUF4386 domain-containing protein [Halalkalibacter sp. APA_J-10(15)]